jgi:alpha-beta hydrolase superfamily lysophospholipase
MLHEETHCIPMQGGGHVALHRIKPANSIGEPVVVAHGTLSNKLAVQHLADYLVAQGFDTWLLEWGGHGQAEPAHRKQNFEYPAFNDLPVAIDFIAQYTGHAQVHWTSHSGGGLLALMLLARQPDRVSQIKTLSLIGAQVTDAAPNLKEKMRVAALGTLTRLFGRTPQKLVPIGPEGEPTLLLVQWCKWNLSGRWKGTDGFDYLEALKQVNVPSLVIAGGRDDVAPPKGCRRIYDALGGPKTWHECTVKQGFSKDFSHSQMIRGEAARTEVFPLLHRFIQAS